MNATLVNISREADDWLCMRASIGGEEGKGYYLVMRLHEGQDQTDMIRMLEAVTVALRAAPPLEVEPPKPGNFGIGGKN